MKQTRKKFLKTTAKTAASLIVPAGLLSGLSGCEQNDMLGSLGDNWYYHFNDDFNRTDTSGIVGFGNNWSQIIYLGPNASNQLRIYNNAGYSYAVDNQNIRYSQQQSGYDSIVGQYQFILRFSVSGTILRDSHSATAGIAIRATNQNFESSGIIIAYQFKGNVSSGDSWEKRLIVNKNGWGGTSIYNSVFDSGSGASILDYYYLKVNVIHDNLYVKLWNEAVSEPSTWDAELVLPEKDGDIWGLTGEHWPMESGASSHIYFNDIRLNKKL